MTREEAIRILRKEIECLSHTKCEDCILEKACDPMNTTPYDSEYIEAYSMAIKALEQEPTPKNDLGVDAISRANARSLICKIDRKYMFGLSGKAFQDLYKGIDDLPSVTPQEPRKGHWISDGKGRSFADYHCSECGLKLALCGQDIKQRQDSGYSLFCGGCGADMREVKDGE